MLFYSLLNVVRKTLNDIIYSDEKIRRNRELDRQLKAIPEYQCLIINKIGQFIDMNYEILMYCKFDAFFLDEKEDYVHDCFKKYNVIELRGEIDQEFNDLCEE